MKFTDIQIFLEPNFYLRIAYFYTTPMLKRGKNFAGKKCFDVIRYCPQFL